MNGSWNVYLTSPADVAGADNIITNLAKKTEPGIVECTPYSLIITGINCSQKWETASLILCLHWAVCANAYGTNQGWRQFCFTVAQIYLILMQESGMTISPTKSPLFNTQIGMLTALFNLYVLLLVLINIKYCNNDRCCHIIADISFLFCLISAGINSVEMYAFSYFYDRAVDMGLIGKIFIHEMAEF